MRPAVTFLLVISAAAIHGAYFQEGQCEEACRICALCRQQQQYSGSGNYPCGGDGTSPDGGNGYNPGVRPETCSCKSLNVKDYIDKRFGYKVDAMVPRPGLSCLDKLVVNTPANRPSCNPPASSYAAIADYSAAAKCPYTNPTTQAPPTNDYGPGSPSGPGSNSPSGGYGVLYSNGQGASGAPSNCGSGPAYSAGSGCGGVYQSPVIVPTNPAGVSYGGPSQPAPYTTNNPSYEAAPGSPPYPSPPSSPSYSPRPNGPSYTPPNGPQYSPPSGSTSSYAAPPDVNSPTYRGAYNPSPYLGGSSEGANSAPKSTPYPGAQDNNGPYRGQGAGQYAAQVRPASGTGTTQTCGDPGCSGKSAYEVSGNSPYDTSKTTDYSGSARNSYNGYAASNSNGSPSYANAGGSAGGLYSGPGAYSDDGSQESCNFKPAQRSLSISVSDQKIESASSNESPTKVGYEKRTAEKPFKLSADVREQLEDKLQTLKNLLKIKS